MHSARHLALALALAGLAAPMASAQSAVLDEGSFRLSVRGTPVGTETFTIRRTGSGANATTVVQGRIVLDSGEQTQAVLELQGAGLRPAAYQIEVRGGNRQNITGRAAGNRFRATIVSDAGEQMREYLVSENAVILDDGVAHQHYFIAEAGGSGGRVPVIIPRQNRQVTAQVRIIGSESIQVAGRQVSARRISIEISGLDPRTVWVDAQNRVLRLWIPDQDMLAERTALP